MSIGVLPSYRVDLIAYGAFNEISKGIFVACSIGNSVPAPLNLMNVAPWRTATVGAGTLDGHGSVAQKIVKCKCGFKSRVQKGMVVNEVDS